MIQVRNGKVSCDVFISFQFGVPGNGRMCVSDLTLGDIFGRLNDVLGVDAEHVEEHIRGTGAGYSTHGQVLHDEVALHGQYAHDSFSQTTWRKTIITNCKNWETD